MHILPMQLSDIPSIPGLRPEGWADVSEHFRYNVLSPHCHPLKAIIDDRIVGIGSTILHKDTAWLASIIVLPEYRNRGIGGAITGALLRSINQEQYPTILLDATNFGYPVYQKFGFEVISEHLHYHGTMPQSPEPDSFVVPFSPKFQAALLAIDQLATGEDRSVFLLEHMNTAMVYVREEEVHGMYLPTTPKGMIVADNPDAGIALMQQRLTDRADCMIPVENKAAAAFLTGNGFQYIRTSRRMRLGKPLEWRGDLIYNTISGARG